MDYSKEELKEFMLKEIEIIQDIIKGMALYSFIVKICAIISVIALLFLKSLKYEEVRLASIIVLIFWYLDAYFIWQKRLYKRLYNWVIKNRMHTDEYLFDIDPYRFKDEEESVEKMMSSTVLLSYYGSLSILVFQ